MSKQQVCRIFVVDDETVIAETLAAILQRWGYSARCFTDPLEALKIAGTYAPDLLISDVMMLKLSGIDLAIRVKELCPDCKVLLLSGQASIVDMLMAARDKGYEFPLLSKPVQPSDLLREIRSLTESAPTTHSALG